MVDDRYRGGGYAADNPDWHLADAPHKARAVARLVARVGLQPRRVVDVGCGAGGVASHLADAWPRAEVSGWDIAPAAIGRARSSGGRARFHVGDPLRSAVTADLVLCLDVAEHVPDDVGLLRDLAFIAPIAVVRLPLDLSALDVLRPERLLAARRRYGHLHAYTRALALARLAEAGWALRQAELERVPPTLLRTRSRISDGVRRAAFRVAPELTVDLLGGWSLLAVVDRA
ncbi:MAG: SAM-dependent methyltransferase [Myxococcota bacterium]|jgi:SAM-dependent methyltransferase